MGADGVVAQVTGSWVTTLTPDGVKAAKPIATRVPGARVVVHALHRGGGRRAQERQAERGEHPAAHRATR